MGNRACIATKNKDLAIYLHWNGGRDSVDAFLQYCKYKGYRSPESDSYGWARLCQVISNFMGGTTSVGISRFEEADLDNYDNGTYIIENWEVVDRMYMQRHEQNEYDMNELLVAINNSQPTNEQIPNEFFEGLDVPTNTLQVGDKVFVSARDEIKLVEVLGFGSDVVNGSNMQGIPYVGLYGSEYKDNCNNYIRSEYCRKAI